MVYASMYSGEPHTRQRWDDNRGKIQRTFSVKFLNTPPRADGMDCRAQLGGERWKARAIQVDNVDVSSATCHRGSGQGRCLIFRVGSASSHGRGWSI